MKVFIKFIRFKICFKVKTEKITVYVVGKNYHYITSRPPNCQAQRVKTLLLTHYGRFIIDQSPPRVAALCSNHRQNGCTTMW